MRIDFDRLTPMGTDGRKEAQWLGLTLGIAAAWNLFSFLLEYTRALDGLSRTAAGIRTLLPGAQMPPFSELSRPGALLYPPVLAFCIGLSVAHYAAHYAGSKSIYLMRRLPDRLELYRRCLGLPVLAAVTAMALLGLQTGAHYLIYILCTPKLCL